MQIEKTITELVKSMDTVGVSTSSRMCPTVDTFVCTAATPPAPTAEHSHFTVRDNYHEIEAVLLEGRPGDTCLPGIISRAAQGSSYAAMFSGEFPRHSRLCQASELHSQCTIDLSSSLAVPRPLPWAHSLV